MIFTYFLILAVFSMSTNAVPEFPFPSPSDTSTSDPYDIYLANTFPIEAQALHNIDKESSSVYLNLVDKKIGTPLYAGESQFRSRRIFVEAFFNHSRTLDSIKETYSSSEICEINNVTSNSSNPQRFVSIFHELNLPFEVPCLSCQKSPDTPNFFRFVKDRKIFDDYLLVNSTPVNEYIKAKADTEGEAQIFAADLDIDSLESSGSFRWSPRVIPENVLNKDTKLHENSMSMFCSKEEDGMLQMPDIIVNVDTLKLPPSETDILNKNETAFLSSEIHRFTVGDLIDWKEYAKDSKLPNVNEAFNLKIDIFWEPWSCCSACCCDVATCGNGFGISSTACDQLSSFKTRRGFLSFFKNDQDLPLNILDAFEDFGRKLNAYNEDYTSVVHSFDAYLSSAPYIDNGIPVHSTLLQSDQTWLLLEMFLNDVFEYRSEDSTRSQLGMFVDSESCSQNSQKLNCTILQQCRNAQEFNEFHHESKNVVNASSTLPSITPEPEIDVCNYGGFEDIYISEKETFVDVEEKLSYRFSVDEAEFGEMLSTTWKFGSTFIDKYDASKCDSQRVFVKGRHLVVRNVTQEDDNLPYKVKTTVKATGEMISLTLKLEFRAAVKESKYTSSIIKWVAIAGGILVVFVILVVIIHVIQVRTLKRKLRQTAAAGAASTEKI